ncbi:MAG: hypothetical protein KA144_10440 [Xanthomonadaceae bacterium]|nr:hypothetical protein [Xanthomonadaceae bacterium]
MNGRRGILGAAALAAAIAAGLWWWRSTPVASPVMGQASATAAASHEQMTEQSAAAQAADPLRSGSLRGTEVDGDVHFDERGAPIPDADLRRLFDYHLSLIGEQSLDAIRAALRRTLSARWDVARVEQVMALFERYLSYREALAQSHIADDPDPARRLAEAKRLRRQTLGEAMAKGFFAEEEALADLTLRRVRIASDADLDPERKREALRALDAAANYDARTAADLPEVAAAQAAELEHRQLSPAQRSAERSALWGPEAAQRLAALDAEQAEWDARVRRYADARARIAADPRLNAQTHAQAIARLRAESFAPNEQRRIASLEAVGQLEAALSGGQ